RRRPPLTPTLFPYTTLFRSAPQFSCGRMHVLRHQPVAVPQLERVNEHVACILPAADRPKRVDQPKSTNQKSRLGQSKIVRTGIADRKSTRLNSSHVAISYAV